ncbi:MAG: ribosomal L7Ae/L30e/S12e/Gadd45 family protein [Clostridia bacterium]|nr:ribosomal L7Ae/L30e/S12e/Gadd45 family protein [Clostridia bacterium]MDD4275920.1 ribosomal L7Ae/L30e/S12e/Gadd45 family protein [Clostridia bacterium]
MNKLSKIDVTDLLVTNKSIVGLKQVMKMLSEQKLQFVILAEDADEYLKNQIYSACASHNVKIVYYESRKELGSLSGITVSAAVIGIIK